MASEPLRITVNKAPSPFPEVIGVETRIGGSKEIATLEVNGKRFTNWTSVHVETRAGDWFPQFHFECSEESPMPLQWDAVQFVPGDVVKVYMGGIQAVFGYIVERHVAFDGRTHGVKLVGCGDTFDLTNSSVPPEKLGSHDGKSWTQLAQDLSSHLKIKVHQVGAVDNTPFDNIHVLPGETISQTLERYARHRNIVIGSAATGGLVAIGEHPAVSSGDLVEGIHMLRANAVVRDEKVYLKIFAMGQNTGSDKQNGDVINKQIAMLEGTSTRNRVIVVVADLADKPHGIQRRALMEKGFTEGSKIEAQITVQGWFKDNNNSNDLWRSGEYYSVNSPSLIMNGMTLGCKGCVYEQSNQGTTTTLNLVDPMHMNGQLNFRNAAIAYRNSKR